MKKALVLGASGGIGSALVKELVSQGTEVTAIREERRSWRSQYSWRIFYFIPMKSSVKTATD